MMSHKYEKSCCQKAYEEGHVDGAMRGIKLRVLMIASRLISRTSMTNEEIADLLEMDKDVITKWRTKHDGHRVIDVEAFYQEIQKEK